MIKKIFALTLLTAAVVLAQVSGKISGKIYSAQGEALPGANILISNTGQGGTSDENGYYFIQNIPPGTYSLNVSYIGYQRKIIRSVLVQPNMTTTVNITLILQALDYDDEVIVEAKRPIIQKDATSKMSVYTEEDIESMPVNNLEDIISTQSNISVLSNTPNAKSGYNIQGIDDIRLRGGRNNEVALLVDGVKVSNPVYGGFGTQIGKGAIRQVAISSGGFSAKYGNALSGVINLTTREPQEKFSGSVEYYSSQPFSAAWFSNDHGSALAKQNIQFTVSSRLPFLKSVSIIVNGEVDSQSGTVLQFDDIIWDDYRTLDSTLTLPSSDEIISRYLQTESLDSVYPGLSTYWKQVTGPDGRRINPLDIYKGWTGLGWNNSYNVFLKVSWKLNERIQLRFSELLNQRYRQINGFDANYDYNMAGQNVQIQVSHKEALILNHTLSAKTFYTLQFSQFYSKRQVRILKDYETPYASRWNIFSAKESNLKFPGEYVPYASNDAVSDPFEYSFYLLGDNRWYSGDISQNLEFRFDLTSQYHRAHKLETGVNFTQLDVDYHSYQNVTEEDPYPTIYHYRPVEGAAYLQHKSELDLLVLNLGLRLDYLSSGGQMWNDPFDPLTTQIGSQDTIEYNPTVNSADRFNISPRIGIAYPLTDLSVLYFNFGHFYQNPNYRDLYRATGDNREVSLIRGNILGNPNLEPEKAVQYELGFQQQFGDNIGLKVNLWAKETTNQVGSVIVPAYSDPGRDNPFTYSTFINNNFGSAKGIELNLNMQINSRTGLLLDYSASRSKVLQATSWDGYWSGDTQDDLPKQETTAPWDQSHVFRANFRYSWGQHQGPHWLGFYPFSNLSLIVMYYGESGLPYTPSVSSGMVIEPYSERWPSSHNIDLKFIKMVSVNNQSLMTYLVIKNLLNRKNVLTGYSLTGSASDPGTASYYTLSSTYWDSRNNNNYSLARIIYWGIEYVF